MNTVDIIVLAIVSFAVIGAVAAIIVNKIKSEKSGGCNCGCEGCSFAGKCNSVKAEKTEENKL